MKSIRVRFMRSYLGAILAVFVLLSAISVYYVHHSIEYHAGQALYFLASQKSYQINEELECIEHVMNASASFILATVDEARLRTDVQYAKAFMSDVQERVLLLAHTAEHAKSIYFCPDVDKYSAAGCFYLLNTGIDSIMALGSDAYISLAFDVTRYDKRDFGHVGWYYEPQRVGEPVWLGPYSNHNLEDEMSTISYVIPLYLQGRFLGVIGMDISEKFLRSVIDNMDYETGFGFLVGKNGSLLYHKDFPNGLSPSDFEHFKELFDLSSFFTAEYINTGKNYVYSWFNVRQRLILNSMNNGMLLAISVPETELLKLQSQMLFRMLLLLVVILLGAVLLANNLASRIIKPLQMLTDAASRIARGELNTPVNFHSNDELGELADSVRKISVELKEYIAYISAQAYTDAMTGIRNKSAYLDKVKELEQRIGESMADFTVYVFDVNGLKRMNDTLGHEFGDMLIRDAAGILKAVFPEDCVYRTGGDEFVVLDERASEEKIAALFATFDEQLAAFNKDNDQYEAELAVSKGAASFDEQQDKDYKSVFARADEAMYACKEAFYRTHEELRRR